MACRKIITVHTDGFCVLDNSIEGYSLLDVLDTNHTFLESKVLIKYVLYLRYLFATLVIIGTEIE